MNQQQFTALVDETFQTARQLLVVKGGEYAGSEDRLANFKRGAGLTGATPMQVALIYLSKHYDGVSTYVKDDANGTQRPRSESIEGRLDDLINYCILLKGLVREKAASGSNKMARYNETVVQQAGGCVGGGACTPQATFITPEQVRAKLDHQGNPNRSL